MKSVITIASLCIFLVGCGGMGSMSGYNQPDKATQLAQAFDVLRACGDQANINAPAYRAQKTVSGNDDPLILQKLTDKELIPDDYREFVLARSVLLQRCEAEFLPKTAQIDYRISSFYGDMFAEERGIVIQMLEGKLTTWGEYNTAFDAYSRQGRQREANLFAVLNNEMQQANAAAVAQQQREAELAMQRYNLSLQQSNNVMNSYLNTLNNPIYQVPTPTNTRCSFIGDFMNCTTY